MSTKTHCDRCDKVVKDGSNLHKLSYTKTTAVGFFFSQTFTKKIELCSDCFDEFMNICDDKDKEK